MEPWPAALLTKLCMLSAVKQAPCLCIPVLRGKNCDFLFVIAISMVIFKDVAKFSFVHYDTHCHYSSSFWRDNLATVTQKVDNNDYEIEDIAS